MVARDRLARGVRLTYPESVALLGTWVVEQAREGAGVEELMSAGRELLGRDAVMPGVAEMLTDVQAEAALPDGRELLTRTAPSRSPSPQRPSPFSGPADSAAP